MFTYIHKLGLRLSRMRRWYSKVYNMVWCWQHATPSSSITTEDTANETEHISTYSRNFSLQKRIYTQASVPFPKGNPLTRKPQLLRHSRKQITSFASAPYSHNIVAAIGQNKIIKYLQPMNILFLSPTLQKAPEWTF